MKIVVVGAGIFGMTVSSVLAKEGFEVDIYEKENDVFKATSGINQFRLHRGYHYPRSIETIKDCLSGEIKFRKFYPEVVIDSPHEQYYAIAKEKSFLDAERCFEVWEKWGLEYEETTLDILNNNAIEKCVKVKESIIDPFKFKEICLERCKKYGVNILLNRKDYYKNLEEYDLIVNTTYTESNSLLEDFPEYQRDYQFELVEKLVLRLPKKFENKSVVIQDGPFCCIDPYGKTGFFLMGNVTHAIHHKNIGKKPEIPREYKDLLNKGLIKDPKITKLKKFLDDAENFFPGIKTEVEHLGSMFTIRTVLPYREYDDARPTIVERMGNRIVSVFSGKIPTCVDVAEEILRIAKEKEIKKKQKISVGIIGIGKWGKQLVRAFNDFSNVKMCVNKQDLINQKFIERKYPSITTSFDYNDVINNKEIDVVVIATPIKEHFEIAKKAIQMNKRVFLEKPISENLKEARELIKCSRGKILFTGHIFLYHPCYKMIKELTFGDPIVEVEFNWNKFGTFDEDVFLNLVSQDLAVANGLVEKFPIKVELKNSIPAITNSDIVSINLEFEGGEKCEINVNRINPQKKKEVRIITKKGNIYYWIDDKIIKLDKEKKKFDILFESEEEPLKEEIKDFLEHVGKNREPLINKCVSLSVIKILETIKKIKEEGIKNSRDNEFEEMSKIA